MRIALLVIALAASVTGCDTDSEVEIKIANQLCSQHGGWLMVKPGSYSYQGRTNRIAFCKDGSAIPFGGRQ